MPNKYDKPSKKNTAAIYCPINAISDDKADALREQILTSKSDNPQSGRVWYVSENGSDENLGNSIEKPWATLSALELHGNEIMAGDSVLFERGCVFRGGIVAKSGVFYGAYGEGDKPCIYGSKYNYAELTWEIHSKNIWKVSVGEEDNIGIVVFNHGEKIGYKKNTFSEIEKDGDFFSENGYVYLYSEKLPTEIYNSIEMGPLLHLMLLSNGVSDVIVDNLTFKYTGGNGISGFGKLKNIIIRNCEVGWIGGSYLPNFKDGTVRFGNGIEFWTGCENCLIENCWIYQIYDSGFSHQGRGEFEVKDLSVANNLIEYTSFGSVEYWAPTAKTNRMVNIKYEGNILRFAGYGWSEDHRPDHHAKHFCTTHSDNYCENLLIKNNILDTAVGCYFALSHLLGTKPFFESNTIIAKKGDSFGHLLYDRETERTNYLIDDSSKQKLCEFLEDDTTELILY